MSFLTNFIKTSSLLLTLLMVTSCSRGVPGGQEARDLAISACEDYEYVYNSTITAVQPGLDAAQEKAQMASEKATSQDLKDEYAAFKEILGSLQWMLLNIDEANTENLSFFIDAIEASCASYRDQ